jgi:hypothetical protein
MRQGSITVGIIIGLSVLAAGEGVAIWFVQSKRTQDRAQAQQAAQEASGALAACEARTVPETVRESAQGTTDALTAALAPHLGQVGVSAALVQSFSQDRYSVELIKVASPRLLAAEAAMTRCALLVQTSDSAVLGCGKEVVDEWQAAMQAQAACPDLTRSGAPGEGD